MARFRPDPIAVLLFLSLMLGPSLAVHGQENWPQFRGPGARGIGESSALPERWSASENVEWKTDMAGRGWSSPIVWGNRVFLTTAVSMGETEEAKKGLYFGGDRSEPSASIHQWKVLCFHLTDGSLLWERQVHEGKPETPIHIKNSYASETPVTDGERVYAYFGNLGMYCFDLEGEPIWAKRMEPRAIPHGWGTAASPALHGNRIYVVNDNKDGSYLLAMDKRTGDEKGNWSTPFVWQNDLRTEIVTPGSGTNRSYDLDGNVLWSLKGMSSITIATPYACDGLLYISSGYVGNRERPLYAIKAGATGEISLAEGETANEWIAWSDPKAAPYNPTTIVYKGRLYVLYDGGTFASFNASDGTPVIPRKRIPGARHFTASPWAYRDKVFCLNEDGVTFVMNTGDSLDLLHTSTLAEDDMCMATPAIAGERLLIRSARRLYCIRASATGDAAHE